MPDNWGFVLAAYALTAIVLGLYWRRLVRQEKALQRATTTATPRTATGTAGTAQTSTSDRQTAERSREPSRSGHPRIEPTSRGPLQQ